MDVFERRVLDAEERVCREIGRELRAPLSGISSAAQLLRFRAHEDPVVERNVGRILREVERLRALADELLEYGRHRPLALAPGDPDAIWDAVLHTHRGLLESRSLAVRRQRAAPPARCTVDDAEVRELFSTLLTHAADAAPPCTELTLASVRLPDGAWRCTLHDGGAAIPADSLPHAFEMLSSARSGGARGRLALCRRIVEEHGGVIGIESEPERGTTLSVTLPGSV